LYVGGDVANPALIPSVGIPALRPTAVREERESTAETQRTQSRAETAEGVCVPSAFSASLRLLLDLQGGELPHSIFSTGGRTRAGDAYARDDILVEV